ELHLLLEKDTHGMGLHMVDPHQGSSKGERETLRETETYEERADQSGPLRYRKYLYVSQCYSSFVEGLAEHAVYDLHMAPRCNLRHHSSEEGMDRHLARHHVGEHLAIAEHRD